jgi:uncharacterized protein (DUF433 family)
MTTVSYQHISIDPRGEPVIEGTGTGVVLLAMDGIAHQWDANEIRRQRPHLTLGQIHSALAYYYDHEMEMNELIQEKLRREEELLGKLGESRVHAKVQAMKRPS